MRRGTRWLLLSPALAALVVAVGSSAASAHHGSQADCSGTADVCRPDGVFTIPWSNSNPSACRFDVTVTWGDGTSTFVPDVRSGQSTSHTYAGHGFFTASTSAVITGANCTFAAGSAVIEVPAPPAPPPPPPPPPAPVGVTPCGNGIDADPIAVGCQNIGSQVQGDENACALGGGQEEQSLTRRLHQAGCFAPVRTATAGRDGTATAAEPTAGNPSAVASPLLTADQEEAIAVIVNRQDARAVAFTVALTKGVSRRAIQQYCFDHSALSTVLVTGPFGVPNPVGQIVSGFAYCMRSLDRALRATGQAPLALMAVEAASCRATPRLVTIRRAGRTRLQVRTAPVRVLGVRARVTCAGRADGSVAIRVKSAAGVPLRRFVGPRLRIGFVQGRSGRSGPVEVRFR